MNWEHSFRKRSSIGETLLEVQHLTRAGEYEDISFKLHKGEILSFTGLVGAGRTELMHSILGLPNQIQEN